MAGSFHSIQHSATSDLLAPEHLAPEPTPAVRLQAAALVEPIQWAPPSISDETESAQNSSTTAHTIPRIIHRMWRHLTSDIPEEWSNATASCRAQNPEYQQYIWTDETAHQFIGRHFPWYLSTYTDHLLPLQRVDALRYFLLWHYGGVFLDPELGCRRSLEPLLTAKQVQAPVQLLLPQGRAYGVGTDMMASAPGHPLVIKLALTTHDHHWQGIPAYAMAFARSGPMVASRVLAVWLRSVGNAPTLIAIVTAALFDNTESGNTFFVRCIGQMPRGDEVAVAQHVFGNWVGWGGAGLFLAVMALVIFGLNSRPRTVTHVLV